MFTLSISLGAMTRFSSQHADSLPDGFVPRRGLADKLPVARATIVLRIMVWNRRIGAQHCAECSEGSLAPRFGN